MSFLFACVGFQICICSFLLSEKYKTKTPQKNELNNNSYNLRISEHIKSNEN